ncbi:hypothetical protein CYLTODRAFT_489619 [Cylindrobasidium torrendii FP15055 ss-10]|uniref:Uncharacterized protein n=1 Tax=Cylindrobasidium torrendii FP15055 ss-10 TaxID=1314674 RepID=A0A0D7BEI8_9AGAR|nr:hypothetical protein CYLTODRAFT_489619 [Cylindrobasidium torrendii FP15055 ss-10]
MAGPPSSSATLTNVMPYSPTFLRLRSVAFALICFVNLLSIVVLCIKMYLDWDITPTPERSLVAVLASINAITVVMLPVLIILAFRPWLDSARFMLLLAVHITAGSFYTNWFTEFQDSCPSSNNNCRLFNIYILSLAWIVNTLLVVYIVCLGLLVWRRSRLPALPQTDKEEGSVNVVEEKPVLDISSPPPRPPRSPARLSSLPIPTYVAPIPAPYTTWTPTMQDRRMTGQSTKSLRDTSSLSHSSHSHSHSHHTSYGPDEFGRPMRGSMSSRFSTMPTAMHASHRPSILPPPHRGSTISHGRPLSSQPPPRSRPLSNQPTPATEKRRTLPALPPPSGGGMYSPGWGYGPPAGFQERPIIHGGSGSHASFQGSIGVFPGPPNYQGQDGMDRSSPRSPTTPTHPHYVHASHQSQMPTPYYQKRMTNPNVSYGVAV